jgi:hypothetical protein
LIAPITRSKGAVVVMVGVVAVVVDAFEPPAALSTPASPLHSLTSAAADLAAERVIVTLLMLGAPSRYQSSIRLSVPVRKARRRASRWRRSSLGRS